MKTPPTRRPLHPETLALLKKSLSAVSALETSGEAIAVPPQTQRPKLSPATAALLKKRSSATPVAESTRRPKRAQPFSLTPPPGGPLDEVVVFDTETTGAGRGARLVEIAGIHARNGKVLRVFQTLIDPEMHIPAFVTMIHGITDAMVQGAPRADAALTDFFDFVGMLPLVAHNASFDRGIVRGELERAGLPLPPNEVFCTLKLSRKLLREAPNHKLSTLSAMLALPIRSTHRAEADCHAALGVFHACEKRAAERGLRGVHGPSKTL